MFALLRRTTRLVLGIPSAALLFAACSSSTGPGSGPAVPSLGTTSTYGILAGSTISCVTGGTVNADGGLSPGSSITGFPPCTISGTQNITNGAAANAQLDLTTAYNGLKGLACGTTISADLSGTTLAPGVYCSASSVGLSGVVTLDGQGNSSATFVIQSGSALNVAGAGSVTLIGSAQAKNVYWQVGSSATLGTGSTMKGTIVALTSITMGSTSTLLGRALARNGAVSLGGTNTITLP